ncbi:MAG: transposase [Candidatus Schekmanbacteria bacterium RBG_13_48_7]|uniref:Transposase n=1 Tax=Candidatus Schekmanbacteria bacterium RBG_13_48_7 TaxID=1817878 RepID=A0A1F7S023_9BACT|nr:MAG: transposase [Candidatus Schekmanbacteria bacterium RBG_13_48_7]
MNKKRDRKSYNPDDKVSISRKHLLENVPVSELCNELNLKPTVFYRWQKELFENGSSVFKKNNSKKIKQYEERIDSLEAIIIRKNEVLADLLEEYLRLKKNSGQS